MGGSNPVTKLVKSVVKFVSKVVKTVVNFIGDIVGFVFNPMGSFDVPQPTTANPEQEAQGVTITKNGTNVAIPVVYGFRRVGGALVYLETNGTSNKYLYAVYAVAEGEIHGFKRILVEDVELPLPANDTYPTADIQTVNSGRFKGRIQFEVFNGTEIQAQSNLANQAPNWPKKQRRMPGLAYVVMRFEWKEIKTQEDQDNNPFAGGIPKVQFDICGKKIFDVRTHGTGKTLASDYGSLTKTYNFNPANCLLDYLMNDRFGCGLQKEEIDAEAFKIAANKYEQQVRYYSGQQGRAMTLNAVIDTNRSLFDNVKVLVGGCRGIMPFVEGRYKLVVEDGGNATDITSTTIDVAFDVTKDYVIGGITLDGERKNAKFNEVIVNYIDPDQNFSNQQVVHSVAGDKSADENETLKKEFTFPTLTNKSIAQDLAILIYKKSRKQRSISFTGTQELIKLTVGDIIRVTDTILALSNDTFRVVDIKLNVDLTVDITAVEHDATIYPFTTGDQVEIPPPLFLPDELSVRPRVKPVADPPLGIVPPVDPDFDSAGAPGETNPLPPEVITPLTSVSEFFDGTDADDIFNPPASVTTIATTDLTTIYNIANSNYTVKGKFRANKGLVEAPTEFYPSTHSQYAYVLGDVDGDGTIDTIQVNQRNSIKGGDFIYGRSLASSFHSSGFVQIFLLLNQPNPSSLVRVEITGFKRDGTNLGSVIGNGTVFNSLNNFLQVRNVNINTNPTASVDKAEFFKVRWIQRLQGTDFEIPFGDDLGADYTYYDAIDKTTKTGRTTEAFINNAFQNASSVIFGSTTNFGSQSGNSVRTNHNLGA